MKNPVFHIPIWNIFAQSSDKQKKNCNIAYSNLEYHESTTTNNESFGHCGTAKNYHLR